VLPTHADHVSKFIFNKLNPKTQVQIEWIAQPLVARIQASPGIVVQDESQTGAGVTCILPVLYRRAMQVAVRAGVEPSSRGLLWGLHFRIASNPSQSKSGKPDARGLDFVLAQLFFTRDTLSDATGKFEFVGLPPDRYSLKVTMAASSRPSRRTSWCSRAHRVCWPST